MKSLRANNSWAIAAIFYLLAHGCGERAVDDGEAPALPPGGETTFHDRSSHAFTFPAPNLTDEELERHLDGDLAFDSQFVTAPAPVNAGLGPTFNNNSCVSCHIRNGRGVPTSGHALLRSPLVIQVSLEAGEPEWPGGPVPVPGLGTQLQDHAVFGEVPEAQIELRWIVEERGVFPADEKSYELRRPVPRIVLANGELLSNDVLTSLRLPPPVFGLGLLEAVPVETLEKLADPDDVDGDGISGRINRVWDIQGGKVAVGRFGWKAGHPSLLQITADDYVEGMGVSNEVMPEIDLTFELDPHTLDVAAFYTQTLAVPARDSAEIPEVRHGERLFEKIGCASCHVPELRTGVHPIEALSHQTIHPYTDLLLHNVGMGLADARPEFEASGTEWRTPPLWGLGLAERAMGKAAFFLHDGRARNLEEAILWHGGEARASREAFRQMNATDRRALLAFLYSL